MANNTTPSGLEEVANSVVHPVTKRTITKYKKLINDPLLQDDWMKGMCKEHHKDMGKRELIYSWIWTK